MGILLEVFILSSLPQNHDEDKGVPRDWLTVGREGRISSGFVFE